MSVEALLRDYPDDFEAASAQAWWTQRLVLLEARRRPTTDPHRSVSSGCAATGARTHAQKLAESASRCLDRWREGVGTRCEGCGQVLELARLHAVPAAVRCRACAPRSASDTRWCR